MADYQEVCGLIRRVLGVDVTDIAVRKRAWRRLVVFRDIAKECEQDGNLETAAMLRRICVSATRPGQDAASLVNLAILAGPDDKAL